ncbi:S24 family peptidase [Sphingobium sp. H39-3-25]|uniref:S24 family peptidase n=1 Tax=Sphingobium arseniciresistens TaxID=3030834 RepID=UPI0023B9BA09|nr:S24 family peptidase [Sphingobium arseniciresistens]
MDEGDLSVRETLAALIAARGDHYGALSRLLGRNPAYIQQFIKRGTPRKLDEADRRTLAVYFGVDESVLGGRVGDVPPLPAKGRGASAVVAIPRMDLGASAGAGSLDDREQVAGLVGFDEAWLRAMGVRRDSLSIIHVDGESMAPTLCDGDEIMVDGADAANRLRAGIYVLRFQDVLMVKRVVPGPRPGLVSILSDNPHFQSWPDVDPAQVALLGRVIWTGRRLR